MAAVTETYTAGDDQERESVWYENEHTQTIKQKNKKTLCDLKSMDALTFGEGAVSSDGACKRATTH